MRKAIIVDDHPFILATVRMLVINAGFQVVAECDNGIEALQQCESLQPDLLVLDLGIPGLGGLEVIRHLRERKNACKIVVLTSQNSEQFTLPCIQAGASGYVSKNDNLSMLTDVINAVMSGYSLFPQVSAATGETTAAGTEKLARLSHREMLVMKYLINGLSNKEIAETLSLSEKTISTYKTRLYTKLNVSNLLELADVASRYEKT